MMVEPSKRRTALVVIVVAGSKKGELLKQLEEHQSQVDTGYAAKRGDKKVAKERWKGKKMDLGPHNPPCSKDRVNMTFDFQKNLPTPNLFKSETFYKRQMLVYNYGEHNCNMDQGHMMVFGENIPKQDSNVVCSCLEIYFTENRSEAR